MNKATLKCNLYSVVTVIMMTIAPYQTNLNLNHGLEKEILNLSMIET